MVQSILSELSSDEVNSISDTAESLQVANIIQSKYYDIVSRGDLPEHDTLFQLTPSNDITKPTLMYVPTGVSKVEWLKYFDTNPNDSQQTDQFGSFAHDLNVDIVTSTSWITTSTTSNTIGTGTKTFTVASGLPITVGQGALATSGPNNMFGTVTSYSGTTLVLLISNTIGAGTFTSWVINSSQGNAIPGYTYVTILPIQQFLDYINRFNPANTDVFSYVFTEGGNNFTFYYLNDIKPNYCTILSNTYVIFDSYDNTQDTTLQASKILAFGQIVPPFTLADSFVPDIDDQQFPLLISEAKALAYYVFKQSPHLKAEQEIKRQWSAVQKNKSISGKPTYFDQLPNMGRMPRTGGYGSGVPAYGFMRTTYP